MSRGEILWHPGSPADSAAGRFMVDCGFASYADLHTWSVGDLDAFWTAANAATGVRWRTEPRGGSDATRRDVAETTRIM